LLVGNFALVDSTLGETVLSYRMALEFEIAKKKSFKKEFVASRYQPFGKTSDYIKGIENDRSEKFARLIKIVGMLLQAKVYFSGSTVIEITPSL
jgi:hypothetical protein